MDPVLKKTFKKGSKTYFNSSLFFPRHIREDVFKLYGFVRVADDYVDSVPQQADAFYRFRGSYHQAINGKPANDVIIDSFVELSRRLQFDPAWTEAFLYSMELDITKSDYQNLDETLKYIYGSAEVIGLYMASILRLDPAAYPASKMMGRAMQYINFIRDIDEDYQLGRSYLPLNGSGLESLSRESARSRPDRFREFIHSELQRYKGWQTEAIHGYRFIPKRYLIPIKTAADMYWWTADQIQADPFIIYRHKVKPGKLKIIFRILRNLFAINPDSKRGLK